MKPILISQLAADRWCHYVIVQERHAAGNIIERSGCGNCRHRALAKSAAAGGMPGWEELAIPLQVPRDLAVEQARNGIAARAMV